MSREVRTVEQDPAGTSQSPECPTCRIGEAVINPLAGIIKIFAFRQRQSASRLGVDIFRIHRFSITRVASCLLTEIAPPSQPAANGTDRAVRGLAR